MSSPLSLTLAVHPTSSSLAWIAFENPFTPHDWGAIATIKDKNATAIRAVERLLKRLEPETFVLEAFEPREPEQVRRTTYLGRGLAALASDRGIDVEIYPHADVVACFSSVGARTRHEIAEAVLRHNEALSHELPKKRRAWETMPRKLALFSAAALALTHYQLSAKRLLDQLRDAV